MKTKDGKLFVISGASRSGKTAWTLRALKRWGRVIVWDPEDQWSKEPGYIRITFRKDLLKAIQSDANKKIAYVAGGDLKAAFDFWAGCAYHWVRYYRPAAIVAEELADVTTVSKASNNWGILLRRGLKRGPDIFCISQRWAEADKTAIGNASEFVVFRANGEDVDYMSRKTRIPVDRIETLKPLQYITKDAGTGTISGLKVLRFSAKTATK